MGSSESKNVSKELIDISMQYLTDMQLDCCDTVNNLNEIVISGNSNVTIDDINQEIIQTVNMTCIMDSSYQTQMSTELAQKAQEFAEDKAKAFSMTRNVAENYTKFATHLVESIQRSFNTNLEAYVTNENSLIITNNENSNLPTINQEEQFNANMKAVMSDDEVTNYSNDMDQITDESASLEVKGFGFLGILAAIGVVIVLVIVLVMLGPMVLLSPMFWFLCVTAGLVVTATFCLGYFMEWWPYDEISENDSSSSEEKKKDHNRKILEGFGIATGVLAAADALLLFVMYAKKKPQRDAKKNSQMMQEQMQQQQMMYQKQQQQQMMYQRQQQQQQMMYQRQQQQQQRQQQTSLPYEQKPNQPYSPSPYNPTSVNSPTIQSLAARLGMTPEQVFALANSSKELSPIQNQTTIPTTTSVPLPTTSEMSSTPEPPSPVTVPSTNV